MNIRLKSNLILLFKTCVLSRLNFNELYKQITKPYKNLRCNKKIIYKDEHKVLKQHL